MLGRRRKHTLQERPRGEDRPLHVASVHTRGCAHLLRFNSIEEAAALDIALADVAAQPNMLLRASRRELSPVRPPKLLIPRPVQVVRYRAIREACPVPV